MLALLFLFPLVCGNLVEHIKIHSFDTSEPFGQNDEYQYRYQREGTVRESWPVYICSHQDGTIRVAWTGKSRNVYFASIKDGNRIASDTVLETSAKNPIKYVRGLACAEDGTFAAMVVWPHDGEEHKEGLMYFILFDADAKEITRRIVDRRAKKFELGDGDLAYGGGLYAAYFKVTGKNPGFSHEGDTLLQISSEGVEQDPFWNWGCSHPQMNEVVYHPSTNKFGAFCTSDLYPAIGVIFQRAVTLVPAVSDVSGHVSAGLGDILPTSSGYLVSYIGSREGTKFADGNDVGMMHIDLDGEIEWNQWVTDNGEEMEHSVHLARFGGNFLLFWAQTTPIGKQPYRPAGNLLFMQEFSVGASTMQLIGTPEEVSEYMDWQERPKFINLPNGDIAFPAVFGGNCDTQSLGSKCSGLSKASGQGYYEDRSKLRLVVIKAPQQQQTDTTNNGVVPSQDNRSSPPATTTPTTAGGPSSGGGPPTATSSDNTQLPPSPTLFELSANSEDGATSTSVHANLVVGCVVLLLVQLMIN